ncbi:MAG: hypothetical protein A3I29_00660 [Candidatus Magasanikbacteria bacterium RIFCSPLOWO2_02_FULL_44_11]|uniref:Cohesin domain-containing protein n=1 Tax=Candidatus Magasanikbacteria bacterium RIFCSPLOWO2_02_FULL_44_11 TaxID=1798689 RepID=A0A1F6NAS8_9BACT|nr:MAG: hypothetical protein A3I29_00660 [Candidatus Magasanikbacteria bacterium RIFCSPLOWO2_02_FULL_44_11]
MRIIKYISLFVITLIPFSAFAATSVSFSPSVGEYREGQTFAVNVSVNSQNPVYTVKAELTYPADLLEVQSFTFANNWMPLTQAGYDLVDNNKGMLIKTAGYPSGLSSQAILGTAVFKVKAKGSAVVKLGNSSMALDANNTNTISNFSSQTTFTLLERVASVAPTPTSVSQPQVITSPAPKEDTQSDELAGVEQEKEAQTAAVSGAASTFPWLWLATALVFLSLAIGFLTGRKTELLSGYLPKK